MSRPRSTFKRTAYTTALRRAEAPNIVYPIFTITGSPPRREYTNVREDILEQPVYYQPDWRQYVQLNTRKSITKDYQYNISGLQNTYVFSFIENSVPVLVSIKNTLPPLTIAVKEDGELTDDAQLCWRFDESLGFYILSSEKRTRHTVDNLYIINKSRKKKWDTAIFKDLDAEYRSKYNPYIIKIYPTVYSDSLKEFSIPQYGNANSIY